MLTQFFDPEPTLKGLTFAKALASRGHEVRVLTGFPNYPSGRLYDGYSLRLRERETLDGIPVERVWLYPSHDRSAMRRMANYGSFSLSSAILGWQRGWQPDLTWVHHPPPTAALAALVQQETRGTPFVLEIQDLWPDTLTATGMVRGSWLPSGIGRWMNWLYGVSDHVIGISEGLSLALQERGVPSDRLSVIRNWADEDRLRPDAADQSWAEVALVKGGFNLVYAGNMGPAQSLAAVVQAAAVASRQVPKLALHMVGDGLDYRSLQAQAAAYPGLVTFHGRQPMGRVAALVSRAGAAVVHLRDDPLFEITIPSKTQAYLYLGAPILIGVRGDAARMVQEAGAGLVTEPEDSRSIAAAMLALAAMSEAERSRMGAAGRNYYERELSVQAGMDRYEMAFRAAAQHRGRRP